MWCQTESSMFIIASQIRRPLSEDQVVTALWVVLVLWLHCKCVGLVWYVTLCSAISNSTLNIVTHFIINMIQFTLNKDLYCVKI